VRTIGTIFFLLFLGSVRAASLPEANLTISPTTIEEGRELIFDASDSKNTNGQKGGLQYRFQFDNASGWTQWGTQSKKKFTPQNVGSFRGKLQVRDTRTRTIQTTYRTYRVTGYIFRKLRIRTTPSRIRAGESIEFELVFTLPRTDDPDKLRVRWDFDSDGYFETNWSNDKTATHVFGDTEIGKFSPTAEVIFPDGYRQKVRGIERISVQPLRRPIYRDYWSKINVLPPSLVSPIVDVSPGNEGWNEQTTFRFDASRSRIADHAWLEWSFDGETFYKNDTVIFKKFTSPGKHEVRARTCYDHTNPKCRETLITIHVRPNPIDFRANVSARNLTHQTSCQTNASSNHCAVVTGDRIRFSAQLQRQNVVENEFLYQWDFQGDGIWDTNALTRSTAEYMYPHTGSYHPTVRVRNEKGVSTKTSLSLRVHANTAPKVNFTIDRALIYPGELVRFYPKVSDLQDDTSQLEVRFDADGDGYWDSSFQRKTIYQWRYENPGKYIAILQVRDQNKNVSTIKRVVTVYPYVKPKARVTISQKQGTTQTIFRFDASRSVGQKLKYYWDFDFKGPQGITSSEKKTVAGNQKIQKKFSQPGEKVISLRVIDTKGNTDEVHFSIFVSDVLSLSSLESRQSIPLSPKILLPEISIIKENSFSQKTALSQSKVTRADIFFLAYQAINMPPPMPIKNPFRDVQSEDWFYDAAIQSYRDQYTQSPRFLPYEIVSKKEIEKIVYAITGKSIDIQSNVITRDVLREILRKY
jgi:hypothetical protein